MKGEPRVPGVDIEAYRRAERWVRRKNTDELLAAVQEAGSVFERSAVLVGGQASGANEIIARSVGCVEPQTHVGVSIPLESEACPCVYSCIPLGQVPSWSVLNEEVSRDLGKEALLQDSYKACGESSQRAVGFLGLPGLVYLPHYLPEEDQLTLANECLRVYANPPYANNLALDEPLTTEVSKSSQGAGARDVAVGNRQGCFWPIKETEGAAFQRLRWVTLGYQYDWTQRVYKEGQCLSFPQGLSEVVRRIVGMVERHLAALDRSWCTRTWGCVPAEVAGLDYQANAGILNFYRHKDRMGGHVDDAEMEGTSGMRPLVSIALGRSCFFLIQAPQNEGEPQADCRPQLLVLEAGDVLVLAGAARRALHGVPRLLRQRTHDAYHTRDKLFRLNRRERRRRLLAEQNGNRNALSADPVDPRLNGEESVGNMPTPSASKGALNPGNDTCVAPPCLMDEFLERDGGRNSGEPMVAFRASRETRRLERSGKERQRLLRTLTDCRMNLSIRDVGEGVIPSKC